MNWNSQTKCANGAAAVAEKTGLLLRCPELPLFDSGDLALLRRVFQKAPQVALRQAWREREEEDFAPGNVRLGWRAGSLLIFAELSDPDIFNDVTEHNQKTWLHGDTFEIFLRPEAQSAYVEFHVTPNNHRLQLCYPSAAAFAEAQRKGCIQDVLVPGEAFHSLAWIRPEAQKWFVYADIPARSVCGDGKSLGGQQWRFSFGRYDYRRTGKEPIISSSSAHAEPDFHRQNEWGILIFQPSVHGNFDE